MKIIDEEGLLNEPKKYFLESKLKEFKPQVVKIFKEKENYFCKIKYFQDEILFSSNDFFTLIQMERNVLKILKSKRMHKKKLAKKALIYGDRNFYKDVLNDDFYSEEFEE